MLAGIKIFSGTGMRHGSPQSQGLEATTVHSWAPQPPNVLLPDAASQTHSLCKASHLGYAKLVT